jgi:hypothetical protein
MGNHGVLLLPWTVERFPYSVCSFLKLNVSMSIVMSVASKCPTQHLIPFKFHLLDTFELKYSQPLQIYKIEAGNIRFSSC